LKIKLDENVSAEATQVLAALGHDVDTVASEGLTGRVDLDALSEAIGRTDS
jgi:antitoxin component of RelBE/YafQ-DinJ toxin-antitoxin module